MLSKTLLKLWGIIPVFVAFTFVLIIPIAILFSYNHFGTTNLAYAQPNRMNSNVPNSVIVHFLHITTV
jgi:hypothetical protein